MELLIQGDCLDVLKGMPDNSVDAVVTDPPYGLSKEPDIREVLTKWMNGEDYHHRGGGFMGKTWDSFVPGPSIWKEVFRVLKPGGHLLCFAGTRTQDLMTISLRLAGFEIRDCIAYLFFSGFPKSLDVGKAFDKRAGAKREVIGINPHTAGRSARTFKGRKEAGQPLTIKGDVPITAPATDLAKKWDGWGSALKPSHEPVILCTKPLPLNYELGILVLETITKILGGPICQRLNVSVSDAAKLFMYFLPKLEKAGVNTVAEIAKIKNWANGEFAQLVEKNFMLNALELNAENLPTVQENAPILLEGVRGKNTRIGKAADSSEQTDTLLSEPMTENIGLNTMLSWSNILAALLKRASMFTTETALKMTTELRTLNLLLGQNTQRSITQASETLNAGLPCDVTTVDAILKDVKRKYLDTENNFAQELVTSKGSEQASQSDHQPIIMARKPLEGTICDNVEKWGTGGLNIDGCRIPYADEADKKSAIPGHGKVRGVNKSVAYGEYETDNEYKQNEKGRFPANCITLEEDAFYSKYFNIASEPLEPAHEPIIMARKPLDGTICDNVEKWGTGAINIDGCRVPITAEDLEEIRKKANKDKEKWTETRNPEGRLQFMVSKEIPQFGNEKGRFPANCITTEPDMFYSKYFNITPESLSKKASKKDRNSDWRGQEINLPEKPARTYGEYQGTPEHATNKHTKRANHHPTVKPTDLMAWLIRLITPPGGIVLDPFAGSGSTLVAAKREGFSFIGIEKEAEYIEIAKARVGA